MPHVRLRSLYDPFRKALVYWPIVSILGPRQCGKSTFLRELAFGDQPFVLKRLDQSQTRREASANPELFLKAQGNVPLVLDEVQKVPVLFDEMKALVDERRTPGRFILTGSVEFSKKTGIRESLTGRTATLRMDSFTLLESLATKKAAVSLQQIEQYLSQGGMPGVFAARNEGVRQSYWDEWLETLCERDLQVFARGRLSGDLARRILELLATLETPDLQSLARKMNVDSRRVQNHLDALRGLFVVREVQPSEHGVGKSRFFLFDCGLAQHLGASFQRKWQCWFLHEWQNGAHFRGQRPKRLFFYQTRRGSQLDFVNEEGRFWALCTEAAPDRRLRMAIQAVKKWAPQAQFNLFAMTEQPAHPVEAGVTLHPMRGVGEHKMYSNQ